MTYETIDYEVRYEGKQIGAFVRNANAKIPTTHAVIVTGLESEAIDQELRHVRITQAYETWLRESNPERLVRERNRVKRIRQGILEGVCDRSGKPFPYLHDASGRQTMEMVAKSLRENGVNCEIVEVERV